MSYNAVLKNENAKVIGRLTLSNLKTLPPRWDVLYRGEIIPKTTDLKTLLCDSKLPLSVYHESAELKITVRSHCSMFNCKLLPAVFFVHKKNTNKSLKRMISKKFKKAGIELVNQALYLQNICGINDDGIDDDKTFDKIAFQQQCIVYLIGRKGLSSTSAPDSNLTEFEDSRVYQTAALKKRKQKRKYLLYSYFSRFKPAGGGGYSFSAVDLEAEHVEGKGVAVRNSWEGYSYGLNIYGTCPNTLCPSLKRPLKQPSYRVGYGFLRIDLNNETFPCPACKGKFPPANFAVCHGRALFRFKKTEGHFEVQTTLLQSFGGIDDYAMFHDGGEETQVEYDWIEVKTVKKDKSLHVCSRCDIPIKMKVDAVLYECGHPVHRECLEDECRICNAKSLTHGEFNRLANNATAKKATPEAGPSGTCGKRKRK